MKKLLLLTAAVLCVAASIFGGYYFYVTNDLQQTELQQEQLLEQNEDNEATDEGIPFKRRGWAWLDENGQIKENGIADALSQRQLYLDEHKPVDGFGYDGTARLHFVPRGPQNLGGRTEAIVLHPNFGIPGARNNGTMWAGGSTGGIWKSTDSGESWFSTNTYLQNYNVSCLALDPADPATNRPMTLYAGTGQSDPSSLLGGGVFKSIDEGMHWVRDNHTYQKSWSAVNNISVTHHNGETIILAGVENYDTRPISTIERGIMRYTESDNTWRKATDIPDPETASFASFDPNHPSTAVASTCYAPDATVSGDNGKCKAWYSTDYGQSWSPSLLEQCGGPGLVEFESSRWRGPANDPHFDSIYFAFQKASTGEPSTIYAQYGDAVGYVNRTLMSRSKHNGGPNIALVT